MECWRCGGPHRKAECTAPEEKQQGQLAKNDKGEQDVEMDIAEYMATLSDQDQEDAFATISSAMNLQGMMARGSGDDAAPDADVRDGHGGTSKELHRILLGFRRVCTLNQE